MANRLGCLVSILCVFGLASAWASSSCDFALRPGQSSSRSAALALVDSDKPVREYARKVAALKPGDRISVNGNSFTLGKFLGGDATTRVFENQGGGALRISVRVGEYDQHDYTEISKAFVRIQRDLKREGVNVPDVLETPSSWVTLVSNEHPLFTLDDLVYGRADVLKSEKKAAKKGLLKFARTVWKFEYIADFRPDQLAWNGHEWVLLDFGLDGSGDTEYIKNFDDARTLFTQVRSPFDGEINPTSLDINDPELRDDLIREIQKERERQRGAGKWFKRSDSATASQGYLIERLAPDPLPDGYVLDTHPMRTEGDPLGNEYLSVDDSIELKILKHVEDGKKLATYEVKLPSGKRATLKVLRSDERDSIDKMRRKIEKIGKSSIIESGPDYVLFRE